MLMNANIFFFHTTLIKIKKKSNTTVASKHVSLSVYISDNESFPFAIIADQRSFSQQNIDTQNGYKIGHKNGYKFGLYK